MLTRRAAAVVLASGAVGSSSPGPAEPLTAAGLPLRLGIIHPYAATEAAYIAFREGLVQLGYVEGQTISIEPRFAEGRLDLLRAFAAELVALHVDLIVAFGPATVRAARWATNAIPVVFAVVQDPVAEGLIADAARPGRNLTGLTNYDPAQPRAQMRLLKEVVSGLTRVAVIGDAGAPDVAEHACGAAAEAEGLQPLVARLRGDADVEGLLAAAREARAGAVLCLEAPMVLLHSTRLAVQALAARVPTMFPGGWLGYGSLLAYGSNRVEMARRLAGLVDRVFKGARPGEMPVEANTLHHLGINLRIAREIGVTIPPGLVARADQIIE